MMKKLSYILILIAGVIFSSCDDYVDIQPRGKAIITNLENLNELLENASLFAGVGGNANEIHLISDNLHYTDDELEKFAGSFGNKYRTRIYNLEKEFFILGETDWQWSKHYSAIATTNLIFKQLEILEGDSELKKQYKGEALVHQAFAYWRLVNMYGVHYGLDKASEAESGVSLIYKYADQNESLVRQSVNAVYELIETNLIEAIELLPIERNYLDRVNKAAAEALLSRVYLHMNKHEQALAMANAALTYNATLLDYNTVDILPRPYDNEETILLKTRNAYYDWNDMWEQENNTRFSQELADLYLDKANDLRISKFCTQGLVGYYYWQQKVITSYFSIGVTVPELMLIKAECLARDEKAGDAMDLLNKLRAKRFLTEAVEANLHLLTAEDADEALAHIVDERRREFHVSGMRFFDIKRLNALHDAGISLTRGDVTWGPNSINWAIPLGADVIRQGKGEIKQNPRE